jgi:hypothetical protein
MTADAPAEHVERPEYNAEGGVPSSENHLRIHCVYCDEVFEGDEIVNARAHIRRYHDIGAETRRERLIDRLEQQKTGGGTDGDR